MNSIAYVQHSIVSENGDCEGAPVSIIEASAAGLPVISTRHAGIPDVIIDQHTGLLVDEMDIEGFAINMEKLLIDWNLASLLGKNGKENIKKNFSLSKHLDIINDAISST